MPTYNSYCKKCDKTVEYIAKISKIDEIPKCKICGEQPTRTIIRNVTGFTLKGSGFYEGGHHGK